MLAEAKGCIKGCDLYVDGRHLLTGRFPDDTTYPDFAMLIVRRRFNEIMLGTCGRVTARISRAVPSSAA